MFVRSDDCVSRSGTYSYWTNDATAKSRIYRFDDKSLTREEMRDPRDVKEDFRPLVQIRALWDVPDDCGTKCFRDPQRQTLPDGDSRSKPCV